MREMDPKLELSDIAHARAGDGIVGDASGTDIARLVETRGTAREFKNIGNKARMLMKTKHITFLSVANQGPWRATRQKSGPDASKEHHGL